MTEQDNKSPVQEAPPMKLDVSVRAIEPKGNLLGFANVKFNDCFVVEDFKILQTDKGLYVGMPSKSDKSSKTGYRDTAKPIHRGVQKTAPRGDPDGLLGGDRTLAGGGRSTGAALHQRPVGGRCQRSGQGKSCPAPEGEARKRGGTIMYQGPSKSPWGKVQTCDLLCPGVFLVSTASHGGTMVSNEVAAFLSPAAKRCGFKRGGYLCFEEDTQEDVVLRELLDKKLWQIPERIKDKSAFEENINLSIRRYNPEYWRARQSGLEAAQAARKEAPARQTER